MFALQLARAAGIRVTGVDNAGKLEFMRALGADEVIDYGDADFTRTGPYDLIIDLVARRSVFAYRRALARGGRYLMVGGTARALLRVLTSAPSSASSAARASACSRSSKDRRTSHRWPRSARRARSTS